MKFLKPIFILVALVVNISKTSAHLSNNLTFSPFSVASIYHQEDINNASTFIFPFIESIVLSGSTQYVRVITPNNVIWPSGAIQNYGTFSCNASITINVEVYVVGVTDADPAAAGTDVHCVIHYGKVMSFGSAWSCIENESMIYAGADNGPNDVFTGTLSLQPGLYEFTCACSDQGFFTDPAAAAGIMWIGTAPGPNAFTNGQVSVTASATNDDCIDPGLPLVVEGSNMVDNLCSIDGLVGYEFIMTSNGAVNISVLGGTLSNPVISNVRINGCNGVDYTPGQCLNTGDRLFIQVGNENGCALGFPDFGDFNLNISITNNVTVEIENNVTNSTGDFSVCEGDDFTLTAIVMNGSGGYTYQWTLPDNSTTNTYPLSITNASGNDAGDYVILVTDSDGCMTTSSVNVMVSPLPIVNTDILEICETNAGSNVGDFNLNDINVTSEANTDITFYTTLADAIAANNAISSPYTSGTVTIYARVEDLNSGCFSSTTVDLIVHPLPTNIEIINIDTNTPNDFTICAGDPINLNVTFTSGTGPYTFDWTMGGGALNIGNPLNIPTSTVSDHSGLWIVTVSDQNGCTGTDEINITVSPNPFNDDCTSAATLVSGTTYNNQCATPDDTSCGMPTSEASVWFQYTVGANIQSIDFILNNLTNGAISIFDNCSGNALGNTTCANQITLDCPVQGTMIYILVTSEQANAGDFNISVSETLITAPNDVCSSAIAIPSTPICVSFSVDASTSIGSCPEQTSNPGCALSLTSDPIVWYTFTTPAGSTGTEFSNIDGALTIFTDCPPNTIFAGGECITTTAVVSTSPNTTYYVATGIPGSSGPVGFDIKYLVGPSNDDCSNASDLTGGSGTGDNSCAGSDLTFNCPGSSYENSVWYTINVEPDSRGVEIIINGSGANPMLNGGAVTVVNDGCTTTVVGDDCFSIGNASIIDCIAPGNYQIQVSSSSANAGEFNITVNQIRASGNGPSNDPCAAAEPINMNVLCSPIAVGGSNVDACNEIFNSGGCNFGTEPTTWHTFTTDPNATSIDIQNITGGAYLGIFLDSPCGTNSPTGLSGADCITGNTPDINITGGTTYFIAVGHPSGTNYTFEITQNAIPSNNTPCTAESIGTATLNTTCCATNNVPSPTCGDNGAESSVWFTSPADPNVIGYEITFNNNDIAGVSVFDAYTGADCNALALIDPDEFRSVCNPTSFNATILCQDFDTQNLYIRVGSNTAGCGTFALTVTPILQTCNASTDCQSAPVVAVQTNGQGCLPGCNLSLCGDGVCDPDGNATYYAFSFDPSTAGSAVFQINNNSFSPLISVSYDCASWFQSCINGNVTDAVAIPGTGIIYVRVEASGGNGLDDSFEVCANAFDISSYACYTSNLTVTRPEYPNLNPNGPYCSGEIVNFCYNVSFEVSPAGTAPPNGNNCQWIQGIVPTIHEGWDLVELPISSQAPPAGAMWLAEGEVDYNGTSPIYGPITLPDGSLGLEYGPGGLVAGSPMPAGWYWASPGSGPLCTDPSDPDTAWGLPGACGSTQNVQVCFNLKVREFQTLQECQNANLKITIISFADGELGCWTSMSCALSVPDIWQGQPACNSIIIVEGDDQEVCSGNTVNIIATASNPDATITLTTVDNPNVTGETLSGTYPFGVMNIFDNLINLTNVIQIVEYRVSGNIPGLPCANPETSIFVTVFPQIEATFTPDPAYTCFPGDCIPLTVNPVGGSGNIVSYNWAGPSFTASGATITVCPSATSTYEVTITDDKGCIGIESIEVEVKDPVTVTIDPTELTVCKDGIVGNSDRFFASVITGEWPYIYSWTAPPGVVGFGAPFFDIGDDMYTVLEESSISTSGLLTLTVTDAFGCTGTATSLLNIDDGPEPTFTYLPFNCGTTLVDLRAEFILGASSTGLQRFELYDCSENLINTLYDNISIFNDVDMAVWGNCFVLRTYTGGGCIVDNSLSVPQINGTEILLMGDTVRCISDVPDTLVITNSSAFSSINWNNGIVNDTLIVSPMTTTTYTVTATDINGCISIKTHRLRVNPLPNISISGNTSLCLGQSATLTAQSNIPGNIFTWLHPASNTIIMGTVLNTNEAGDWLLSVVSPQGCQKDTILNINVSSSLNPTITGGDLCDNSSTTLDAGTGFGAYNWSTGETTQTITTNVPGDYSVTVSLGGCSGADTLRIQNFSTPTLGLPNSPIIVCRTNSGFGPTAVDFNSYIDPSLNGQWVEITSSGVSLNILSDVSFLGIPAGNYAFEYTTSSAVAPCNDVSDTLIVTVNPCICPQIIPFGPLCNEGSASVNLNNQKGNPSLGGSFTIISPDGTSTVTNIFNPQGLMEGNYSIVWDITPDCQPSFNVSVVDSPEAMLSSNQITLCNDNATGTTIVDLTTLVTGDSGFWRQISGPNHSGTLPIVDGIGLTEGDILRFRFYTNNALTPCRNDSTELVISIRNCSCPLVNVIGFTECNGNNTIIDLNTLVTTDPSGLTGTWTSTANNAITDGRFFNPSGLIAGPYSITFSLNSPTVGCQNSFTAPITIRRQPVGSVIGIGSACNENNGIGTTTINLNSLLSGNTTTGGTWVQTSPVTPQIPIVNGTVNYVGIPVNTQFTYAYTVPAITPCDTLILNVSTMVTDCSCPPINLDIPPTLCNMGSSFDLASLELPGNSSGVWSVYDADNNVIQVQNNILNPNGLNAGLYRLEYLLQPAPQGNCTRDTSLSLEILNQNNASLMDTTMCNAPSTLYPSSLDLNELVITSTSTGVWRDLSGVDITNPNNFSTIGINPSQIQLNYFLTSPPPCIPSNIPVTIDVIDCNCPIINLLAIPDICTQNSSFDLRTYADTNNPGNWVSTMPTLLPINNGIIDLSSVSEGIYEVDYVLINPVQGCPDSERVMIQVFTPNSAGNASSAEFCLGSNDVLNLYDRIEGESIGGTWSIISGNPIGFNANQGQFTLTGNSEGEYVFRYSFSNQAPCPDDFEDISIRLNPIPIADAGLDQFLDCNTPSAIIGGNNSSQGTNIVYEWTLNGNTVGSTPVLTVTQGGSYRLTVRNTETNCADEDIVIVNQDTAFPIFDINVDSIKCYGDKGSIQIVNLRGGMPPYQISFDNGQSYTSNTSITNLNQGIYNIIVIDAAGCANNQTPSITFIEPSAFTVNLGPDMVMTLGNDTTITLLDVSSLVNIASIQWFAQGVELVNERDKSSINVVPQEDTNYEVIVTTLDGCIARDILGISLRKVKPDCIPNVFHPNSTSGNNFFSINCEDDILSVSEYRIYDRWGNLLFERKNINPIDKSEFWNGTFNGRPVEQGVYVYYIELLYIDNTKEASAGDITVIR